MTLISNLINIESNRDGNGKVSPGRQNDTFKYPRALQDIVTLGSLKDHLKATEEAKGNQLATSIGNRRGNNDLTRHCILLVVGQVKGFSG